MYVFIVEKHTKDIINLLHGPQVIFAGVKGSMEHSKIVKS